VTPRTKTAPAPPINTAEDARAWLEDAGTEAPMSGEETLERYPDFQSWDRPLGMPGAEHDPGPAEQQAYADAWRADHPGDAHEEAQARARSDGRGRFPVTAALYAWREAEAQAGVANMLNRQSRDLGSYLPCRYCGANGYPVRLAGRGWRLCSRHEQALRVLIGQAALTDDLREAMTADLAATLEQNGAR
jgi:hypothetical protein